MRDIKKFCFIRIDENKYLPLAILVDDGVYMKEKTKTKILEQFVLVNPSLNKEKLCYSKQELLSIYENDKHEYNLESKNRELQGAWYNMTKQGKMMTYKQLHRLCKLHITKAKELEDFLVTHQLQFYIGNKNMDMFKVNTREDFELVEKEFEFAHKTCGKYDKVRLTIEVKKR